MLDALWHNVHITACQMDIPVAKADYHIAVYDYENLIRLGVAVPHKFTLNLNQLKMLIIHLGNDFRCPMV